MRRARPDRRTESLHPLDATLRLNDFQNVIEPGLALEAQNELTHALGISDCQQSLAIVIASDECDTVQDNITPVGRVLDTRYEE